ncbi:hypothetical protein B0T24DRAFT_719204 [Lasiosphaeria ovina]|uniref:Uncharacterized protein n=1 Tax=Lasiosphaeria ovina TaxID=92902 RepID=A0AAE0KJD4_9PEZI|nr:hypothetical protein B0T24DRAFT_719204 [Lasiosphaeria ovina]
MSSRRQFSVDGDWDPHWERDWEDVQDYNMSVVSLSTSDNGSQPRALTSNLFQQGSEPSESVDPADYRLTSLQELGFSELRVSNNNISRRKPYESEDSSSDEEEESKKREQLAEGVLAWRGSVKEASQPQATFYNMTTPNARAIRGMLHVLETRIDNAIYCAGNLPVPFIKLSGASVKALRAPRNQLPELNPMIEGYIKAWRNPISPSIFPPYPHPSVYTWIAGMLRSVSSLQGLTFKMRNPELIPDFKEAERSQEVMRWAESTYNGFASVWADLGDLEDYMAKSLPQLFREYENLALVYKLPFLKASSSLHHDSSVGTDRQRQESLTVNFYSKVDISSLSLVDQSWLLGWELASLRHLIQQAMAHIREQMLKCKRKSKKSGVSRGSNNNTVAMREVWHMYDDLDRTLGYLITSAQDMNDEAAVQIIMSLRAEEIGKFARELKSTLIASGYASGISTGCAYSRYRKAPRFGQHVYYRNNVRRDWSHDSCSVSGSGDSSASSQHTTPDWTQSLLGMVPARNNGILALKKLPEVPPFDNTKPFPAALARHWGYDLDEVNQTMVRTTGASAPTQLVSTENRATSSTPVKDSGSISSALALKLGVNSSAGNSDPVSASKTVEWLSPSESQSQLAECGSSRNPDDSAPVKELEQLTFPKLKPPYRRSHRMRSLLSFNWAGRKVTTADAGTSVATTSARGPETLSMSWASTHVATPEASTSYAAIFARGSEVLSMSEGCEGSTSSLGGKGKETLKSPCSSFVENVQRAALKAKEVPPLHNLKEIGRIMTNALTPTGPPPSQMSRQHRD